MLVSVLRTVNTKLWGCIKSNALRVSRYLDQGACRTSQTSTCGVLIAKLGDQPEAEMVEIEKIYYVAYLI